MKKLILLISIIFIIVNAHAGKKLQVFFQHSAFNIPQQDPYLETYMTAIGKSAIFKKNNSGKFQASIVVTMLFKQNGSIVTFNKYNLLSPEVDDTLKTFPNFIDQQRIPLKSGIYNFELMVMDENAKADTFVYRDIITIEFPKTEVCFSGVQLLEKYETTTSPSLLTKNNYDLYPYVSDFFPENIDKLSFYTEIYNSENVFAAGEDFLLKYYIETANKKKVISAYSKFKKLKPLPVNVVLAEFDISELGSGNYNLVFDIINKENKLLKTKKVFFQRSKVLKKKENEDYKNADINNTFVASITNLDTIKDYLKCLRPVASEAEKRHIANLLKKDSLIYMQKFFYNFWESKNFGDPQNEWENYKKQVDLVNRLFKTPIDKGYESERGRVYLQYGSPNQISENRHDPVAYPNEIWQYYNLNGQANVKFVFYNPDLVTESYRLLHSDLKGEIQNNQWEKELFSRHDGLQIPNNLQGTEGTTNTSIDGRMKK